MHTQNCWEFRQCGLEPGGLETLKFGVCPAASDPHYDGLNGGKNGGRVCWVVPNTCCGGRLSRNAQEKMESCLDCLFRFKVVFEQGPGQVVFPSLPRWTTHPESVGVIFRVMHGPGGDVDDALRLAGRIRAHLGSIHSEGRIALLHDASHLHRADVKYHDVFAELEAEFSDRVTMVAAVFPNVVVRMLAQTVHAVRGGARWIFYESVNEAVHELSRKGYRDII